MTVADEEGKRWWQTLPAILTGIAATVTAVAGLIVAVQQTGWLAAEHAPRTDAPRVEPDPAPVAAPARADEPYELKLPERREYRLGNVLVYTLLAASVTPRSAEQSELRVHIRLKNGDRYPRNLWDRSFRLEVQGSELAPFGNLNEVVESRSMKDGEIAFKIPRRARKVLLEIREGDDSAEIPLELRGG